MRFNQLRLQRDRLGGWGGDPPRGDPHRDMIAETLGLKELTVALVGALGLMYTNTNKH